MRAQAINGDPHPEPSHIHQDLLHLSYDLLCVKCGHDSAFGTEHTDVASTIAYARSFR